MDKTYVFTAYLAKSIIFQNAQNSLSSRSSRRGLLGFYKLFGRAGSLPGVLGSSLGGEGV